MTQSSQYHEIAAEARMMSVPPGAADSLGFEDLGYIGPAPPDARLIYYVEYGDGSLSEPERRLFIASSTSLPQLPKPAQPPKPSRPRKPSIRTLVKQAEQATGKAVTSITMSDGTKLELGKIDSPKQGNEVDEWMAKHARAPERHS